VPAGTVCAPVVSLLLTVFEAMSLPPTVEPIVSVVVSVPPDQSFFNSIVPVVEGVLLIAFATVIVEVVSALIVTLDGA